MIVQEMSCGFMHFKFDSESFTLQSSGIFNPVIPHSHILRLCKGPQECLWAQNIGEVPPVHTGDCTVPPRDPLKSNLPVTFLQL